MPNIPHPITLMADTLSEAGTPLDALLYLQSVDDLVDDLTRSYVRRARAFGCTWAEIGAALGVTLQAAQQRYGA
jgi:hypothetical protein